MRFKCFVKDKDRVVNSEMVGGYTMIDITEAGSDGGEKITFQIFEVNSPALPKPTSAEFLERAARVVLAHFDDGSDLRTGINVFAYNGSSKMFDGALEKI